MNEPSVLLCVHDGKHFIAQGRGRYMCDDGIPIMYYQYGTAGALAVRQSGSQGVLRAIGQGDPSQPSTPSSMRTLWSGDLPFL
jgi:hypothetical protein